MRMNATKLSFRPGVWSEDIVTRGNSQEMNFPA